MPISKRDPKSGAIIYEPTADEKVIEQIRIDIKKLLSRMDKVEKNIERIYLRLDKIEE